LEREGEGKKEVGGAYPNLLLGKKKGGLSKEGPSPGGKGGKEKEGGGVLFFSQQRGGKEKKGKRPSPKEGKKGGGKGENSSYF